MGPMILCAVIASSLQTFMSCEDTLWTVWGFSEQQMCNCCCSSSYLMEMISLKINKKSNNNNNSKIWRPYKRNTVRVEFKVIPIIMGDWNHFRSIQKIPVQHLGKAQNQGTTANSHTRERTHTAESTNVKV